MIGGQGEAPRPLVARRASTICFPYPARTSSGNAATTLSGGQQQMVAIGRALMSNPDLLLVRRDQPRPRAHHRARHLCALPRNRRGRRRRARSIVEQDVMRALGAARRVYCLQEGRVALEASDTQGPDARGRRRSLFRGLSVMDWVNSILQGVLVGGLYALFAAGLSLIFGVMRLVNIAHGDFIVLGGLPRACHHLPGLRPRSARLASACWSR